MESKESSQERVCAAMCGNAASDTAKFFPICPNGHSVHAECFQKMLESNENPCCPLCRDDTMSLLKDMIVKQPHMNHNGDDDNGLDGAILMMDSDDDSDFAEASQQNGMRPAVLNFTGTIQNLTMVFLGGGVSATTGFTLPSGGLIPLNEPFGPQLSQVINHPQ